MRNFMYNTMNDLKVINRFRSGSSALIGKVSPCRNASVDQS
jgi:hypothetical protein